MSASEWITTEMVASHGSYQRLISPPVSARCILPHLPWQKSHLRRRANHLHSFARPVPLEGRTRNATFVGAGCDGRSRFARRARRGRTVKPRGPDLPTLRSSLARGFSRGDGGQQARSPGESAEQPLTPLRRERRLCRLPCCCLRAQSALSFARKARGCGQHPVFPAPSVLQEGHDRCRARAFPVARMRSRASSCLKIESGFEARSVAELVDQIRPAIEHWQDRIGLGGIEADHHARDTVVAVALEQIEVLIGAPECDRH